MGKSNKPKSPGKKGASAQELSDGEDGTVEESVEDGLATPTRKTQGSSRLLISEAVEKLSEKRFTTREKGMEQLIKHFQTSHENTADLSIDGYQESILTQVLRSIRRPPSLKEGVLCTDLISLLSLYLGPNEDVFLSQVEKPLRHLVRGTRSELAELRGKALCCLAFTTFISGGVDAGYRVWQYCAQVLREDSHEILEDGTEEGSDDGSSDTSDTNSSVEVDKSKEAVAGRWALRSAAATSWVLLATLRTPEEVLASCAGHGGNSSLLEPMLELLQHHDSANAGSIEIKIAAGKCIAFLWEVASASAGVAADPQEVGALLCRDYSVVEKVLDIVKQVAKDSSKRISKKDRKEQRSEFRTVEDLIFRGEAPEDSMRMQGAVVEVGSFKEMAVVEALRLVLGSGFHSSLRLYDVVKDVLGVEYLTSDMDGAGQDLKVGKGSSADKSRSNYRKQDRRYRAMNTDFGGDDCGEEA